MIVDSKKTMEYITHRFTPVRNKLLNKLSNAEAHFENLLREAGIYYVREKTNFKMDTRWCYYDFFLPFYRLYIELDGKSHDGKEQKAIDREKEKLVRNRQRFIIRIPNEKVMSLDKISIEDLILMLCEQNTKRSIRLKRSKQIKKMRVFTPIKYFTNVEENYLSSIHDSMRDTELDLPMEEEIYMFSKNTGLVHRFQNLFVLRMNLQRRITYIIEEARSGIEGQMRNKVYIFGKTQQECIERVKTVLSIDIEFNHNLDYTCSLERLRKFCHDEKITSSFVNDMNRYLRQL